MDMFANTADPSVNAAIAAVDTAMTAVETARADFIKACALRAIQGGGWEGGATEYQELRERVRLPAVPDMANFPESRVTRKAYAELKAVGRELAPEGGWRAESVTPEIRGWIEDAVYEHEIARLARATKGSLCDRIVTVEDTKGRLWYGVSRDRSGPSPLVEPVGWTPCP